MLKAEEPGYIGHGPWDMVGSSSVSRTIPHVHVHSPNPNAPPHHSVGMESHPAIAQPPPYRLPGTPTSDSRIAKLSFLRTMRVPRTLWSAIWVAGTVSALPPPTPSTLTDHPLVPVPCGAASASSAHPLVQTLDAATAHDEANRMDEELSHVFFDALRMDRALEEDQQESALGCVRYSLDQILSFTADQRARAQAAEAAADAIAYQVAAQAAQSERSLTPPVTPGQSFLGSADVETQDPAPHSLTSSSPLPPPPPTLLYAPEEDWEDEVLPIGDIERAHERAQAALAASKLYSRPDPMRLHYSSDRGGVLSKSASNASLFTATPHPDEDDTERTTQPRIIIPDLQAPSFVESNQVGQRPLGSGGGQGWSWRQCPGTPWRPSRDAITVESVRLSPDPPVPGQNLTIQGWGNLRAPIHQGSTADVLVRVGLTPVHRERLDLCAAAEREQFPVQCPAKPGEYHLEHTTFVPKNIPRGLRYTAHVTAENHQAQPLLCLDVGVTFSPFS